MSGYMLLVLEDESAHAAQTPKDMADLIERRARFADALGDKLRDTSRLRPSREGKRVYQDRVEAGPFTPALGAYYWVEADSIDEAAKLAADCPTLPSDEIDVRPLMKGQIKPGKEAKPGKIFACAVLGNALTEAAWLESMDRIDNETSTRFPAESALGGNRLQPPTTGKRVVRAAVFDGPFLEAKEVIGGVFLMRMASIDDVVEWAQNSRFIAHGALEIRELWRT
jgi:hypothetical protein